MAKKENNNGLISAVAVAAVLVILAIPFYLASSPKNSLRAGHQRLALQKQKICRYLDKQTNKYVEIQADGPELQYDR